MDNYNWEYKGRLKESFKLIMKLYLNLILALEVIHNSLDKVI